MPSVHTFVMQVVPGSSLARAISSSPSPPHPLPLPTRYVWMYKLVFSIMKVTFWYVNRSAKEVVHVPPIFQVMLTHLKVVDWHNYHKVWYWIEWYCTYWEPEKKSMEVLSTRLCFHLYFKSRVLLWSIASYQRCMAWLLPAHILLLPTQTDGRSCG